MYASNFREIARNALRGKWKKMAWLTFLAMLLGAGAVGSNSGVSFSSSDVEPLVQGQIPPQAQTYIAVLLGLISVISLWTFFMGSFVRVGQTGMIARLLDGENPRAGMLFPKGVYGKSLGLSIVRSLLIALWSLLLVVPGIIASYSYAMSDYILAMHPEMGAMEALRESKRRMKGRRFSLFCLQLSFIGWELLSLAPAWLSVIVMAIVGEGMNVFEYAPSGSALFIIFGILFIGGVASFIASLFVYAYMNVAAVAFFKNVERSADWQHEAREGEEYAKANYGEGESHAYNYQDAVPHFAQPAPAEPVYSADETVAKDVFTQHKCSRALLEKAGLLEEYEKLNASPISEARWKRDYADSLMRRFDQDPSVLDSILALCMEYAMDDLANRALQRIDRHIRQQTLPDADILNMCGRVCTLLGSGCFDGNPGYVDRKKAQVLEMANRLEIRLSESDPSGSWREMLNCVQGMCK